MRNALTISDRLKWLVLLIALRDSAVIWPFGPVLNAHFCVHQNVLLPRSLDILLRSLHLSLKWARCLIGRCPLWFLFEFYFSPWELESHLSVIFCQISSLELPYELKELTVIHKLRREDALKKYRTDENGLLVRPYPHFENNPKERIINIDDIPELETTKTSRGDGIEVQNEWIPLLKPSPDCGEDNCPRLERISLSAAKPWRKFMPINAENPTVLCWDSDVTIVPWRWSNISNWVAVPRNSSYTSTWFPRSLDQTKTSLKTVHFKWIPKTYFSKSNLIVTCTRRCSEISEMVDSSRNFVGPHWPGPVSDGSFFGWLIGF